MAWIQVHDQLLCSVKLRRLAKSLGCSRNEALGILISLWLFAVSTADCDGLIECVEPKDIYTPTSESTHSAEEVTEALIQAGFLDHGDKQDSYIVHDWSVWQAVWITEKRRRDSNAEYMRGYRERERTKEE